MKGFSVPESSRELSKMSWTRQFGTYKRHIVSKL